MLLGVLVFASSAARGAVLAYEGFAYPSNSGLDFQNGGAGFSGVWATDFVDGTGAGQILPGSLSAGGLQNSGNHAEITGVNFVPKGFSRSLASPAGGAGATVWMSFVMRGAAAGNSGGVLINSQSKLGTLLIGQPQTAPFFGLARIPSGLSIQGPTSASNVPASGQALLVARLRFAAGADIFDLWVNPPGGTAPATPDASLRFDLGSSVNHIQLVSWGAKTGSVTYGFDELRFGDSFADVTPGGGGTPAPVGLSGLRLTPSRVPGGQPSTGTVLLSAAPTGAAVVRLSSRSPLVQVPESVTVPPGAISATFPVTTVAVSRRRSAAITASFGGITRSALLWIEPPRR